MKTSIIIKGAISGNTILFNSLDTINCEIKKLQYNNKEIIFKTKKEAVLALSKAFQELKFDEPDYYKEGGISYKRGLSLNYDASTASIL